MATRACCLASATWTEKPEPQVTVAMYTIKAQKHENMLVSRASATQNIAEEHLGVCSRHSIAVCVASIMPNPSHSIVRIINDAIWTDERASVRGIVGLLLLYVMSTAIQIHEHAAAEPAAGPNAPR